MVKICPSSKDLASKFLVPMGCNVFLLLYPVEEREGENGDGGNRCQAPAAWESSRRKISVFVMSLLQNISFRDKALLLGMMGRALL